MTQRVLTERELNRALLCRQLLLERAPVSIPRALERMGGLQAQYAPSMYVGLWSRMEGFERDALTRALERRSVVQGTLMRSTIHLVSARDYWPLALAVERARRDWWLKANRDGLSEDVDELVDLPRAPLPDPQTPAPVRLLGTWDAILLAHARRANVLPERFRDRVFHVRMPQSVTTFLVDGAVAGTWRHDDGRVTFDPFQRLDRATLRALREEGEQMAALHA